MIMLSSIASIMAIIRATRTNRRFGGPATGLLVWLMGSPGCVTDRRTDRSVSLRAGGQGSPRIAAGGPGDTGHNHTYDGAPPGTPEGRAARGRTGNGTRQLKL
ncbi:hypothetical protein GCM10017556_15060 [Micromonospora sagamiensis]|nr:hypothetical protein GCM10017556_15060 [Micromonospora sagamiensis]